MTSETKKRSKRREKSAIQKKENMEVSALQTCKAFVSTSLPGDMLSKAPKMGMQHVYRL